MADCLGRVGVIAPSEGIGEHDEDLTEELLEVLTS